MRRVHYIVGLATLLAFVLSGQVMSHHHPDIHTLDDGRRMLFVSRHIYLLASSLLNLALGLYLRIDAAGWRRSAQFAGSALIAAAPVIFGFAFLLDSDRGPAARTWLATYGWIALLLGILAHFFASLGARRIDTTPHRL